MGLRLDACSCCGNHDFVDSDWDNQCRPCINDSPPERWDNNSYTVTDEFDGSNVVTYDDLIASHDKAIYESLKELDDAK